MESDASVPVLRSETVGYLVAVAALRTDIPAWREWVGEHEAELSRALSRAGYLRLKFSPEAEVPCLLSDLGIEYGAGLARHLRIAARGAAWAPLNAEGQGVAERCSTQGVVAVEAVRAFVRDLAESQDPERGVRLGEMVLDAEHLIDEGRDLEALDGLRAVAALSTDDDLIANAVWDARQALLRICHL